MHGIHESEHLFEGSGTMIMTGGTMDCPICGRPSPIVDGDYAQARDGRPRAVLRPTPAQAARLKNFLQWGLIQVQEGTADEEDLRKRLDQILEKEAPAWRKAVSALLSERAVDLYQLLGFLMLLLTFFGLDPAHQAEVNDAPPPAITQDEMRELFDEYLEQLPGSNERDQPAPEPTEPTREPPTIQT
ncbi:hypothetical protein CHE218_05480 [Microbacterium sp. che218]